MEIEIRKKHSEVSHLTKIAGNHIVTITVDTPTAYTIITRYENVTYWHHLDWNTREEVEFCRWNADRRGYFF